MIENRNLMEEIKFLKEKQENEMNILSKRLLIIKKK